MRSKAGSQKTLLGPHSRRCCCITRLLDGEISMTQNVSPWTPAPERIQALAKAIVANRESMDFMTVAKAMVLGRASFDRGGAIQLARNLGISKQTWHLWFTARLEAWVTTWEGRMAARLTGEPPAVRVRQIITDGEWRWMARVLKESPGVSWAKRQNSIAMRAAREPAFGHLRGISPVTLWRNRVRLTELGRTPATQSD